MGETICQIWVKGLLFLQYVPVYGISNGHDNFGVGVEMVNIVRVCIDWLRLILVPWHNRPKIVVIYICCTTISCKNHRPCGQNHRPCGQNHRPCGQNHRPCGQNHRPSGSGGLEELHSRPVPFFRYTDSTTPPLFKSELSSLKPSSVLVQLGLSDLFGNHIFEPRHEKTNNVVSEQVRHNPVCTVTKNAKKLKFRI